MYIRTHFEFGQVGRMRYRYPVEWQRAPVLAKTTLVMADSSSKSLTEKLEIKGSDRTVFINAPKNYERILGSPLESVSTTDGLDGPLDFIQFFTKNRADLACEFPKLKEALAPNGMLWISWPKKASRVKTDVDENVIREIGLANGLVDVKVCSIDDTWSALKFVYRVNARSS